MTSFELYMKVPDTITTDDIWEQRGDEILEGSRFKAMDNGWGGCGDWEYDDIHSNFRKFDGGMFTTDDDGDWEYSSTEEIDEEDYEEESCKCNWEDKYD